MRFQKLRRFLFLTLHWHNIHVHRQQQQLSKFLMRYQHFASHAYCGAAGSVSKMASRQEKVFCVLRFEVSRSNTMRFLSLEVRWRQRLSTTIALKELRDRITHAQQTVSAEMPHRVGDEFDYRVDVCHVTQGVHIEGLWLKHEKLGQLPLLTVYVVPVLGEK